MVAQAVGKQGQSGENHHQNQHHPGWPRPQAGRQYEIQSGNGQNRHRAGPARLRLRLGLKQMGVGHGYLNQCKP